MTRPNLLVIMSDDHAQWAAGCYGAQELHTPALDHLAAGGLRMANAFTPSPVCSPARASFFTGLLPSQHGIHDWLWYNVNARSAAQRNALAQQPSLAGQQTLAQRLSAAGYHCGLSGKWHCGDDDLPQPGFAYWDALRRNTVPRDGDYSVDGQLIERSGWHSDIITDGALRFLRQRESDQPFFLFVGYIGTHSPWRGHPQRLVARYRDRSATASFADIPQDEAWPHGNFTGEGVKVRDRREALAQYYAAVTHIDEGVGRLLDELEAQGLREDTLVVYTADHGLNCSQHGLWGKGNATRPPNMLEESIRVPLLLNWPGHVSAGHTSEHFVDHCDLYATLIDLAGLDATATAGPGRSFAPLLTDAQALPDWRQAQAGEYGPTPRACGARSGTSWCGRRRGNANCSSTWRPTRARRATSAPTSRNWPPALGAQLDAFFAQYDDPVRSGLLAPQGPRHNFNEAWRAPLSP